MQNRDENIYLSIVLDYIIFYYKNNYNKMNDAYSLFHFLCLGAHEFLDWEYTDEIETMLNTMNKFVTKKEIKKK